MTEKNSRKKRQEHPVKEWISDNLRYIILIAIIAAAAIVIALAVKAAMNKGGAETGEIQQSQEISQSQDDPQTQDASQSQDSSRTQTPDSAEVTETPKTAETSDGGTQDINSIVVAYFTALQNADPNAAAAVMENLTAEDAQLISDKSFAQSYGNIETYVFAGDKEGTYVAFAVYDYVKPDSAASEKGLTQLYLVTEQDGSIKIASEEDHPGAAEYMAALLEREEVKELISSVEAKNANQ